MHTYKGVKLLHKDVIFCNIILLRDIQLKSKKFLKGSTGNFNKHLDAIYIEKLPNVNIKKGIKPQLGWIPKNINLEENVDYKLI